MIQQAATLDPNWFYSSLAQSAASIVGLLGAILVTRLQTQLAEVRQVRRKLVRARQRSRESCGEALRELEAISSAAGGLVPAPPHSHAAANPLAGYQPGSALYEQVATCRKLLTASLVAANRGQLEKQADELLSLATIARADIRALTLRYLRTVHRVSAAVGELEIKAHVGMPRTMLFILGWLCAIGVLTPMMFLSPMEGNAKVYLWTLFAAGIAAILLYIHFQILEIKRAGRTDLRALL